jgi:hypothetical protein
MENHSDCERDFQRRMRFQKLAEQNAKKVSLMGDGCEMNDEAAGSRFHVGDCGFWWMDGGEFGDGHIGENDPAFCAVKRK